MELATSLNAVFDGPTSEMPVHPNHGIDRCAAAGFRALDFNYNGYRTQLLEQPWSIEEALAYSIRAHAEAAGVRLLQMHGPIFAVLGEAAEHEALRVLSERSLKTAAILGVRWVVFHTGTVAGAYDAAHRRELRHRNASFFTRLLRVGESVDVGVAVENGADSGARGQGIRRAYGAVPEDLIDLVDALNHPLFGICWDTGHAHLQGLDQGAAIRALGPRLKATHIDDNDGRADQHLLPYHGRVAWPAVMQALAAIDYQGAFAYEVHNAIRVLPDPLRDAALRYAYAVGQFLLALAG